MSFRTLYTLRVNYYFRPLKHNRRFKHRPKNLLREILCLHSFCIFDRGLGYGLVGGHSLDSANTSFEILRPTKQIPIMFFYLAAHFLKGITFRMSR